MANLKQDETRGTNMLWCINSMTGPVQVATLYIWGDSLDYCKCVHKGTTSLPDLIKTTVCFIVQIRMHITSSAVAESMAFVKLMAVLCLPTNVCLPLQTALVTLGTI